MTRREREARERVEEAVEARETAWVKAYGPDDKFGRFYATAKRKYGSALRHLLRVTREEARRAE